MPDLTQQISTAVECYRLLQDVQWNEGELSGWFLTQQAAPDMKARLEDLYLVGNSISHQDGKASVILNPPNSEKVRFVKDWDGLLSFIPCRMDAPEEDFYVADDDYWHSQAAAGDCQTAQKYFAVVGLVHLLRSLADHKEFHPEGERLIFLHQEKLEIVVRYKAENLEFLPSLSSLLELLNKPPHQEQKQGILKTVLVELLRNSPVEGRFVQLLKAFEEVARKTSDNYQVYISGFSFEAERERIEERKIEYMVRLNGALTEIQNKFLAVPLALLLAGGQMEDKGEFTWKNCSILVGAIFFGLLMFILVNNQKHTLHSIREEINHRRARYAEQDRKLFDRVKEVFEGLNVRYNQQLWILNILHLTTLAGLLLTIWVFSQVTPEFWPGLLSIAKSLVCSLSFFVACH